MRVMLQTIKTKQRYLKTHYYSAGKKQYISCADHWISRVGWRDLVSHETTNWFCSPYLQTLAPGEWKLPSLFTLIECNFVLGSWAHTAPVFCFTWLTFGNTRYVCRDLEGKKEQVVSEPAWFLWLMWEDCFAVITLRSIWNVPNHIRPSL